MVPTDIMTRMVVWINQFFDDGDKMILETSVYSPFNHLTRFLARGNFTELH